MATNEMVKMLTEKSVCDSPFAEKVCYDAGQEIFGFDSANINMVRKKSVIGTTIHRIQPVVTPSFLGGMGDKPKKRLIRLLIRREGHPPPPLSEGLDPPLVSQMTISS